MLISNSAEACSFLDRDNLEFSGLDPRHRGEIAFDFAEKFVATRYQVPGKSPAEDFDSRSRTLRDLASRQQRSGGDGRVEEFGLESRALAAPP